MNNTAWIGRVERIFDEGELVALVRDYVATWPAATLDALPHHCRPRSIENAQDVALWAYNLAACHRAMPVASGEDVLLELSTFFGEASRRVAILAAQRAALVLSARTRVHA